MKSRLLALSLLMFASALIAVGCDVAVSGPSGGGSVTVECTADDDPCSSDAECCSDICADDGACGIPVDSCLEDNSSCSADSDCCSDICADDGFCGLP